LIVDVDHNCVIDGRRHDWQWPLSIDAYGGSLIQSIGICFTTISRIYELLSRSTLTSDPCDIEVIDNGGCSCNTREREEQH
jgi:hypothetical protein